MSDDFKLAQAVLARPRHAQTKEGLRVAKAIDDIAYAILVGDYVDWRAIAIVATRAIYNDAAPEPKQINALCKRAAEKLLVWESINR